MIDEELYKRATDELNSEARKPDVWARACALASDDHDEARFLYTNLRVEEMLNKDGGKKRTFNTTRKSADSAVSSNQQVEELELSFHEDAAEAPSSVSADNANRSEPLPIDDLLHYEANDDTIPTTIADSQSLVEPEVLSEDYIAAKRSPSSTASGIVSRSDSTAETTLDNDIVSQLVENQVVSSIPAIQSPESKRTALLSEDLQRQVREIGHTEEASYINSDANEHLRTTAEQNNQPHSNNIVIKADYADSEILAVDQQNNSNAELNTGKGRPFMVYSRNGSLKALKSGNSWPAMLFTFPWLLSKSLVGTAMAYGLLWIVSLVGLYTTANLWVNAGPEASMLIKLWTVGFALIALIGLLYIPFRYGNSWVANKVQKRGYEFESVVKAPNKKRAMVKFANFR